MSYLHYKTDIEIYREQCKTHICSITLPSGYETCRGDKLEIVEVVAAESEDKT